MRAIQRGRTMTAVIAVVMLASIPARAADAPATVAPTAKPDPSTRFARSGQAARRIVVSLPDRKLALLDNNRVVARFDVAVGAPSSPTPIGSFTIVNRIPHPTYYRPGKVIAPGAGNPLGTRWLGLNHKGYGIHGTDDPRSIGYAKSHGCIRLRNADVERLFEQVRAGDVVELHAERTEEIAQLFD